MYYLMNFLPVIINLILWPFLHLSGVCDLDWHWDLLDIQCVFNLFMVPAWLLWVNIIAIIRKCKKIGIGVLVSFLTIVANALIGYIAWGLQTGLLWNPDVLTVMVCTWVDTGFPFLAVLVGLGIFCIVRRYKAKKQR